MEVLNNRSLTAIANKQNKTLKYMQLLLCFVIQIFVNNYEFLISSPLLLSLCVLSCFSCIQLFMTRWTVAHQAPLGSQGILQARILKWVAALLQGIFLTQGLNPCLMSPALAGSFFITSGTWEALPLLILALKGVQVVDIKSDGVWMEEMETGMLTINDEPGLQSLCSLL